MRTLVEADKDARAGVIKGGARRRGREFALGLLFQADVGGQGPAIAFENASDTLRILLEQWEMAPEEMVRLRPEIDAFGRRLCEAYFLDSMVIDAVIDELSHEWALERMPGIDRNILRMALAELRHFPDVPTSAAINEAVELAKTYGTEDSGKFVNGILGAYARREGVAPGDIEFPEEDASEPIEADAADLPEDDDAGLFDEEDADLPEDDAPPA